MGIKGGMSYYYSIKNLQLTNVLSITRKESQSPNPNIFVDCNWVAHRLCYKQGDYMKKMVDLLSILSRAGFVVHPIVDGDTRHHSKLVSYGERTLGKETARVNVQSNRVKALALTAKILSRSNELSADDKQKIETERLEL